MYCLFRNIKKGNHRDNLDIIKSKIPDLVDIVLCYEETPITYNQMDKHFSYWINNDVRWGAEFCNEFKTPLVISFFTLNQTIYNNENKREIMQKYLENLLTVILDENYDY